MAEAGASVLLLRACLALLASPIYLLSFLGVWEPFCRKVFFPFILDKICVVHDKKSKKHKQELFRNLPDFRGPSGELRLLEIGTGGGSNFQFYPPGCKVTCTDINPNFQESLSRNMKKNQHLHYERFLVAAGEDLHQVPSGSVDAVVCTLVLCSVNSVSSTLREVLRVLRPVSTWKKTSVITFNTYPGLDQTLEISKLGIAEATRDQERRQIKVWSLISINTERLKVQGHGVNPLERGLKQLSKS